MSQLVARKSPLSRKTLYFLGAVAGVGVGVAISMWAKLGTTVFFESIRTGLAYCFG